MSIIFNEYEYAKEKLETGFKKFICWNDLLILAKYFRYEGYDSSEIRQKLMNLSIAYESNYNDINSGDRLDRAVKKSEKQSLKFPSEVYITENEIEKIRSIKNYKYEKILFVMLVVSRNNKMSYKNNGELYFINENFSYILSLAKVYATKNEGDFIKHYLYSEGMIEAMYPNNKYFFYGRDNFKLLYADANSPVKFIIKDLDNMLFYYKPVCEICGKEMEIRKRRKTCDSCYQEIRKNMKKNWIKNSRNKNVDR